MVFSRSIFAVFVAVVLTRLIAASLLPVVQDEAYYFVWARYLDWGYFDHPPGVALVALSSLWGDTPLIDRLGTLLTGLATLPLLLAFYKEAGLNKTGRLPVALTLATLSIGGVIGGLLVAPDVGMIFAWVGGLWAAARALNSDPRWWLMAGLFTGVGLLSKYVMLIIGPIFLWGLLRGAPHQLKTPWPYLGGVIALLIFSPHLHWNAQNDWVTFRFQLKHGLSNTHDVTQEATPLPAATKAEVGSSEYLLAQHFIDPDKEEKPRRERGPWEKRSRRYEELVGSQLALWGALLLGLIPSWVRAFRRRFWKSLPELPSRPLVFAATVFPLAVFGVVAWTSKVEANWPAIYMIGAAAWLTPPLDRFRKLIYAGAGLNVLLILVYAWHSAHPMLPIKPRRDRVLRDTAGYAQVAHYARSLSDTVLFDTYQTGAMLAHYQPTLEIAQWPGITRSSEFIRRAGLNQVTWEELREKGSFWLLIANRVPPALPDFSAQEEHMLAYCMDDGLIAIQANQGNFSPPCPETRVRTWYAVRYNRSSYEDVHP